MTNGYMDNSTIVPYFNFVTLQWNDSIHVSTHYCASKYLGTYYNYA